MSGRRVAHVIKNLPYDGGTTRYLHGLLSAMDRDQFPSEVLVLEPDAQGKSDARAFADIGVPVTHFDMRHSLDLNVLGALQQHVRSRQIALVQTHLARAHIYGGLAARRSRIPFIITEHGIWRNLTLPVRLWDNLFGRAAARIVCNSNATRQQVRRDLPLVPSRRLAVIYPGVTDCSDEGGEPPLSRADLGLTDEHLVVGHAGTFNAWRRQECLVEAFAILAAWEPRARLLLMGAGPLQDNVCALVHDRGLDGTVTALGARRDTRQILRLLDSYANPATAEAFGIATVEAMLAALPVVVADRCALPELITHEENGLVVPADNPAALAEALLRIFDDREQARRWGSAARARARARFSPETFARQFETVYREVLST